MTTATRATTLVDGFHKHLDECDQCRDAPLSPCEVGSVLLTAAATASADVILEEAERLTVKERAP